MLNLAIHTFLVYKNCIQRKLHCSVLQFTDTAFQWLFKARTEFKLSSFRLPEGALSGALHWQASWYKLLVLWSFGYCKESWGRYWYLLFTHTACKVKWKAVATEHSVVTTVCQKLLFHQSDYPLPHNNLVSFSEYSSSLWKASLSQHWVFLD